ncbi:hypothetical protein STHERM_c21620 [Spirochaeta thermophila DSM 6192]|uniref:Uncharacterized protein n=1 Tax=Winmispira thermophila (strain ATCC 49972 / DSM 6192 / RI 19.B1) TaxID=665571 RepID=E0RRB4_WINT6|nr:hypothetical protein STHERM_c21620 [Spirochaeta thermophila DSM 6192]
MRPPMVITQRLRSRAALPVDVLPVSWYLRKSRRAVKKLFLPERYQRRCFMVVIPGRYSIIKASKVERNEGS